MTALYFDSLLDDEARRRRLYAGDVFVYSPTAASLEFCEFARAMIRNSFASRDPELAQHEMPVAEFAALLAELKPRFIHHAESKRLIRAMLLEFGCSEVDTYFDVPRLRSSTSDGYLTTGIAYAFHPHRDTWYSAPFCQLNWWMPVFDVAPNNVMAFHPQHWTRPVANTSSGYDYQRWNATSRFNAAQHVGTDTREQPKPLEPVAADPDLRVVAPVGGVMIFSGAQLHSSIPNTSGRTRYSIDFRTVHGGDAAAFAGAANIDSRCTGTSMPDYLRVADLVQLPQPVIDRYMPGHPQPVRE
ncbi:MAG: hypothetical protein ABIX37_11190 [Gammaproteobacteria bacterium]